MILSQVSPEMQAFGGASARYASAIKTLQSPLEIAFPVLADQAKGDVAKAVELLTPFASSGDMFTSRNAASSIANAKEAVTMLDEVANAAADTRFTLADVVGKLQHAQEVLWYE
jgi:hypothetical protein